MSEDRGGGILATPSLVDRLSDFLGKVAAWMFFAVGAMITYDVVARYVFVSPTIWAEEMSRFFQIWATYLAAAYVLRHRDLITIDVVLDRLGRRPRRLAQLCALAIIIAFCLEAIFYGTQSMLESIRLKRATATMLAVPLWMTELAIPTGFGALLLQAFVEFGRLLRPDRDPREP
jgi:C4-dicarboxylate transporter DctQ subunit